MHYAIPCIKGFLGSKEGSPHQVAFVPYAGVTVDGDTYNNMAKKVFGEQMGFRVNSLYQASDPAKIIKEADVIMIAGGNTNVLMDILHNDRRVREAIKKRVLKEGVPYIGWSAGANIAFGGMETTNDMNIKGSQYFEGLGLIEGGLRLNPHFVDAFKVDELSDEAKAIAEQLMKIAPESVSALCPRGESRTDRIKEYLALRTGPVIGLYEGGVLEVRGSTMTLRGVAGAKIFMRDQEPTLYAPGDDLSFLLA